MNVCHMFLYSVLLLRSMMRVVRLLLKTTGTGSRWRAIVMIHKMVLIYNHYIHLNTYLGSSVNVLLIPLVP